MEIRLLLAEMGGPGRDAAIEDAARGLLYPFRPYFGIGFVDEAGVARSTDDAGELPGVPANVP